MISAVAQSVAATINASGQLDSFGDAQAVRRAVPRIDFEASDALQVLVVAPRIERTRQNRKHWRWNHVVQVGVLQRLAAGEDAPPDHAAVDPLVALVEELANLTYADVADAGRVARHQTTTIDPLFDASLLETDHQFASVQTLTFVEFR